MIDIFISRPTWVAPEFKAGLDRFLRFLESVDIRGRTIGSTDFASKSPMDEVIKLMGYCKGAIILGYPQVTVTAGKLKDEPIVSPMLLPTEWNHIEAGLAYAHGLPLLVVHHIGVHRGIFDRGTVNSFIYKCDLTDTGWCLKQDISGALSSWRSDVVSCTASDSAELPSAAQTEEQDSKPELNDEQIEILSFLSGMMDGATVHEVARHLNIHPERAKYWLELLSAQNYLTQLLRVGSPSVYSLSQTGRGLLIDKGLL